LKRFHILILCVLFVLTSCGQAGDQGELKRVGLLVPDTINDQAWGTKGYRGLLKIQDRYHIDAYYKEGMNSQTVVERAVKEFAQKEVNLIYGHGHEFVEYFNKISVKYPDIHFITFNGDAKNSNITSLNFESYAMGFFAGMVAGYMTETNRIGMLPAFEWQPEIQGFYDGAKYQNDQVQVKINYVHNFDDVEKALQLLDTMLADGYDIIYPAGDRYSVPVIEKIKEKGLYAIGYISDQSDLGNNTVLTSTIQHVDVLYEVIAEKFNKGEIESGNLSYDFQDGVVSLGPFSPLVDQEFIDEISEAVQEYRETGKLPNQ
jgi:transcriptional activator of comK gene